jgi:hypothetical protein
MSPYFSCVSVRQQGTERILHAGPQLGAVRVAVICFPLLILMPLAKQSVFILTNLQNVKLLMLEQVVRAITTALLRLN